MRARLKHILADLPIQDPIARRQAPLLLTMLLFLLAASFVRLIFFLPTDIASIGAIQAITIDTITLLCPLIAVALLLRGAFRTAVVLTALEILITLVIAIVATGLRHSGMLPLVFALPIVFTGVLVDWRGLLIICGLSIAVITSIATLEGQGSPLVGFAPSPEQPGSMASIFIFVTALLFLMLRQFRSDYRRELEEHRRTAVTLRESELRSDTIFRASPAAMSIARLSDEVFIDINVSYEHIFGYRRDEIIGQSADAIQIYANPAQHTEVVQLMRERGSLREAELTLRTKSGELREVICSLELLNLNGEMCIMSSVFDITDRKRTEQARHEMEQKLSTVLDLLPVGIAILDSKRTISYVNSALGHILELDHEQLLSGAYQARSYLQSDGTPMPSTAFASVQAIQQRQPIHDIETGIVKEDGSVIWTSVSAVPVTFPDWSVVTVTTDITARKHVEAALRESEARFATAFRASPIALMLTHLQDGRIIDMNESYCRLLECQPEDAIGKTVFELNIYAHPSERETVIELIRTQGRIRELEVTLQTTSGALRNVIWALEVLHMQGETCLLTTAVDITARKRAENDLQQTAAELRRSNAELEQFAYVASHDLQEPLRAVAGMVQLLQRRYQGQFDARADQYIEHAVDGSNRMQALINDLLTFSRVGTRANQFAPTQIASALHVALANLAVAIRESRARITHTDLPTVWGDESQITQLLQNLIGNAIKFCGDQPPEIEIRAERLADSWRISVRDNGIGIDPQYFERIFVVFQRLHTRRAYPGTGIGLALCKKIVERHGGRLAVESAPGQGATFSFTIPDRTDAYAS